MIRPSRVAGTILKETTDGEFRVYRASIRLLEVWTFHTASITVTTHLNMSYIGETERASCRILPITTTTVDDIIPAVP